MPYFHYCFNPCIIDNQIPSERDIIGMESISSNQCDLPRTDCLLNELARLIPRSQIPDLLELIWLGLVREPDSTISGESHPISGYDPSADETADSLPIHLSSNSTQGSSRAQVVCNSDSTARSMDSNIPHTEAGYIARLLIALVRRQSARFKENQVESFIHSAYTVYPNLSSSGLRSGVLIALAELGKNWPVLCLKTITTNALPLDLTWNAFLAAIAFLPVGSSANDSLVSVQSNEHTSSSVPGDVARTTSLPRLLSHVLYVLECCLPYERREIPVDLLESAYKYPPVSTAVSDDLISQEVRFGTHAWLAFINCLQILSYPVDLDQMVHCFGTNQISLRLCLSRMALNPKQPEPKRRLFSRTSTTAATTTTPTTITPIAQRDNSRSSFVSRLVTYIREPSVCCRLLGHCLLAHVTAAGCRTPIGKSYETRSGAEANLKHGLRPLMISAEGLHGLLETCGLHPLLQSLAQDPLSYRKCSLSNKTDSEQLEVTGPLCDPDSVLDMIDVIIRYVIEHLPRVYLLELVNFFQPYLNSTYEPYRATVTKSIISVLCHSHQKSTSIFTQPTSSIQSVHLESSVRTLTTVSPDLLFTQLLGRLQDASAIVRRVAVVGLGEIGRSAQGDEQTDSDTANQTSEAHPNASLIERHSAAVARGLFVLMNENDESDASMLYNILRSLSSTMPYINGQQINPLIGKLCQRLWPIYYSSTDAIRAAAFELFGTLIRFALDTVPDDVPQIDIIAEARSVLIPVLLHLADPSPDVVSVCKTTLKKMVPVLFGVSNLRDDAESTLKTKLAENGSSSSAPGSTSINLTSSGEKHKSNQIEGAKRLVEFSNNCLRPDLKLHQGEFFNELARLLVTFRPEEVADYTMRCTVFYNADWPEVQCSAILFSGFLMSHFTDEIRNTFPRNQVCQQLLQLLRSNSPEVRATTAHAISRLYRF